MDWLFKPEHFIKGYWKWCILDLVRYGADIHSYTSAFQQYALHGKFKVGVMQPLTVDLHTQPQLQFIHPWELSNLP